MKNYIIVLVVVISALLYCTGNNGNVAGTITETDTGILGAFVEYKQGNPAVNARVYLYKPLISDSLPIDSTYTDAEGKYHFDTLASGIYKIFAEYIDTDKDTLYAHIPNIVLDSVEYLGTDTLKLPGKIAGSITTKGGWDKDGVLCYIPGTSYLAITDTGGVYAISNIPPGTYTLGFKHEIYNDTLIGPVSVSIDSTTFIPPVKLHFNQNQFERDISGKLVGDCKKVDNIKAFIYGDGIPVDTPRVFDLSFNDMTNSYSGFIYVPVNGLSWNAIIHVYDSLDRRIGVCETEFDKNSGDIVMPEFLCTNAVPIVTVFTEDSIVSLNDSIHLTYSAVDSFGEVVSAECNINGEGFVSLDNFDTVIVAPDSENLAYKCVIRVADDEGNVACDTKNIRTELDPPIPNITVPDSVPCGDEFDINVTSSLPGNYGGSVVKYEWSIGAYNNFVETKTGDTTVASKEEENDTYVIVLRVTDDDNQIAYDTAYITLQHLWVSMDIEPFTTANPNIIHFSFDKNNIPVIATHEYRNIVVKKLIDKHWEVYCALENVENLTYFRFLIDQNNDIILLLFAVYNNPIMHQATVLKWNGNSWDQIGSSIDILSAMRSWFFLGIDDNNSYYCAYRYALTFDSFIVVVRKFSEGNWGYLDSASLAGIKINSEHFTFAVAGSGVPYISYSDSEYSGKATVRKFNGTTWKIVGNPGFSEEEAYPDMYVSPANTPYVIYPDWSQDGRMTVMKFHNDVWKPVGKKGFSGTGYNHRFEIGNNGVECVSFGTDSAIKVLHYHYGEWRYIDNNSLNSETCEYSLAINSVNALFIAYKDIDNGYTLKRYR